MKHTRSSDRRTAPEHIIDGSATFEQLAVGSEAPGIDALHVHFDAGARTRWHTHPLGQVLVVTAGVGWVQSRGGNAREVRAGDVVYVEAGEEHWHGASAASPLSHLAFQRLGEGDHVAVLESVADDHYNAVDGALR